ncbi:sensor domain-containing diguanylate cyclase [Jeongeupia naejangsanensis]|uniref:diguanylate cyclase n=1 Tax=Jeongeupia naejangsanensis TaxID=613195 RepID=A0ABS2BPK5_9NEIS|nr:sensor domain-containing diguanylate cyclase [Jeongeupia naejangsanensis]MBM3117350.1 diguanylate cyclase [Jeongeupia naejangsanensis]
MQGIKSKILAKPLELGLVLFLVLGGAWLIIAEKWSETIVVDNVATELRRLEVQKKGELAQTIFRLNRRVALLKAVPLIVAQSLDVRRALIDPDPHGSSAVYRMLSTLADTLPVGKIMIFDRTGTLVMSSDPAEVGRLSESTVQAGRFFNRAMGGYSDAFYGVDAISGKPGFYFSVPIQFGDMVLGAVVVKLDLDTVTSEILNRNLMLIDQNGVIVASSDAAFQLMAHPGAKVERLPEKERYRLYRRNVLKPLVMHPSNAPMPDSVVMLPDDPVPYLHIDSRQEVAGDMAVHMLLPLDSLTHLHERQRVLFWPMLSAGFLALALALMLLIYLVRTRLLRQQLTVANLELRRQAESDPLTGLANRRKFDVVLEAELARAHRYAHSACLAIIDIDFFKRVNDVHGHPAGDAALVYLADILALAVRNTDMFARLGGEEFGLVLPETDEEGAAQLLERLRAAIEAGDLVYEGVRIPLTISIGFASVGGDGDDAEQMMRRADEALYAAKQGGRNRVCAAPPC